ncbi:MAG: M20/M25/M40 family metallo-hydrolase, partial [Butyricicoccus sp.]
MPKTKDLYIDIGAASKAAAEDKVSLGDYGVFDSAVVEFGDGLIKAKAIDDRVGCAALLKLIEDEPPIDTWFCFTVQEEVGLRGAASMAYALDPGFAMVLEGTTAADLAEVEGGKAVCRVRGGVVLPFMDGATIYDAELFELLRNACDKRGIRWQTKTRVAGGTDAGRIHKSRAGVRVCAAAAPVRYIHSPSSVAAAADCEAVLSAARAFLEELGGDDE